MGGWLNLVAALVLQTLAMAPSQANHEANSSDDVPGAVTISLTERELTEKVLQLRYQIRNDSDKDIWICESMDLGSRWGDVEVYVGQDNETLFIQRRLDVPMSGSRNQPIGQYVRVPSGHTRTETVSLSLPVHHRGVLSGTRAAQPPDRATRLVLEIGYYEGNLPATVFRMLAEAQQNAVERPTSLPVYGTGLLGMIGGTVCFNDSNRRLRARDEQVTISWTDRALRGEKVLRMTTEDLPVPYSTEYVERTSIRVTPCRQIKARFRGSPLGFYFPYPQEQSLLSPEEKRQVESLKGFIVDDSWDIMGIAHDASEGLDGVFHTGLGAAHLTCYRKDGSVLPLVVYDNAYVVTEDGQVFRCLDGLDRLRTLSPQVRALDLRMQCAANLKDLWHCLRLYHIARHAPRDHDEFWKRHLEHGYTIAPDVLPASEKVYPAPAEWSDILAMCYRGPSRSNARVALPEQVCPGAGDGRCHYAMNPNCRYDSPGDEVLLFETQAGWNQHGGPELFSFTNHDPRGGCVLLNDGTVCFIRTPAELCELRWK
jgi:hypothetical protein